MSDCPICDAYIGLEKDFPLSVRIKSEFEKHKESHNKKEVIK